MSDRGRPIVVPGVDLGGAPGSVVVVGDDTLRQAPAGPLGARPGGLGDLLVAARLMGTLPDAMSLVGVQPSEIDAGEAAGCD